MKMTPQVLLELAGLPVTKEAIASLTEAADNIGAAAKSASKAEFTTYVKRILSKELGSANIKVRNTGSTCWVGAILTGILSDEEEVEKKLKAKLPGVISAVKAKFGKNVVLAKSPSASNGYIIRFDFKPDASSVKEAADRPLREGAYSSSAVVLVPHPVDFVPSPGALEYISDFFLQEGDGREFLLFDNGFLVHSEDAGPFKDMLRNFAQRGLYSGDSDED